jgi:outer membrane protein TolC
MLIPNKSNSQKISTDSLLTKVFSNDQLLPQLIVAAQKFSPEVKRMSSGVDFATANQNISKNLIFSGISFLSSYQYGTNYSAVNEINNPNRFSTNQTGFYNLGVGLQLPVSQILNRKHLQKATQAQIEMVTIEKEGANLYVKQKIIEYYQDVKLSHKLMLISSSNRQAAQINYKMGERDFLQGQITVEQNARLLDIYNKSRIEYETYLNKFQTSLMQLDAYTGTSFSSLLNQIK